MSDIDLGRDSQAMAAAAYAGFYMAAPGTPEDWVAEVGLEALLAKVYEAGYLKGMADALVWSTAVTKGRQHEN